MNSSSFATLSPWLSRAKERVKCIDVRLSGAGLHSKTFLAVKVLPSHRPDVVGHRPCMTIGCFTELRRIPKPGTKRALKQSCESALASSRVACGEIWTQHFGIVENRQLREYFSGESSPYFAAVNADPSPDSSGGVVVELSGPVEAELKKSKQAKRGCSEQRAHGAQKRFHQVTSCAVLLYLPRAWRYRPLFMVRTKNPERQV